MKINLLTAILLIIILALCSGFLLYNSNEKITQLEEELNNLKSVYSAELDKNNQTETENTTKTIPSIFTATEKNKTQGIIYSFEEQVENLSIDIKNGTPYISALNYNNTSIEDLASYANVDKNQIKIKTNEYTEITGFSKKVINAHIGTIGQDFTGLTIAFLMEDGTVEYSTLSNILTNVCTQGKIEGLNNIVNLYSASANDNLGDEGTGAGYATIVALDNENYFYNLNDYL